MGAKWHSDKRKVARAACNTTLGPNVLRATSRPLNVVVGHTRRALNGTARLTRPVMTPTLTPEAMELPGGNRILQNSDKNILTDTDSESTEAQGDHNRQRPDDWHSETKTPMADGNCHTMGPTYGLTRGVTYGYQLS